MRLYVAFAIALAAAPVHAQVLVPQVKGAASIGDFASARNFLGSYRKAAGVTPEYLEALSWIARGELAGRHFAEAEAAASEVRALCLPLLSKRPLDSDASLATALGASIEVQALARASQGQRGEAVSFLQAEALRWRATSIRARIQKNLNLLSLEGKAAPALDVSHSLTNVQSRSLAAHKGQAVLLFFWAHWCSDCKAEIAVIQQLQKAYGPKGLVVIAPTQTYGYVAGGVDAPAKAETEYIRSIRSQYYEPLGKVEMPLSQENFAVYGVSTTPTLVLVDRNGIVRMYHPGNLTYADFSARIAPLLAP